MLPRRSGIRPGPESHPRPSRLCRRLIELAILRESGAVPCHPVADERRADVGAVQFDAREALAACRRAALDADRDEFPHHQFGEKVSGLRPERLRELRRVHAIDVQPRHGRVVVLQHHRIAVDHLEHGRLEDLLDDGQRLLPGEWLSNLRRHTGRGQGQDQHAMTPHLTLSPRTRSHEWVFRHETTPGRGRSHADYPTKWPFDRARRGTITSPP